MAAKNTLKTAAIAFGCFALFWLCIVSISGSLFSGYHLMDDSIIIRYNKMINENGLWYAIRDYLSMDFHSRFRPVWVIEFITGIYLKGDNFFVWSFLRALFIAATSTILFFFAKQTGFTKYNAILFSLMVMLGQQSSILWMLGPAEVPGIFFLSLSLLAIDRSLNGNPLNIALFIMPAILMSLSKESFIFFIPALYIWRLWRYSTQYNRTFWEAVRENILIGILLAAITIGELYIVVKISTNFGYAGVDAKLSLLNYLKPFVFLLAFSVTGLVSVVGFVIILFRKKFNLKEWFYPALLFVCIVLPQIVVYAKSGIQERYFLPGVIGFVVLVMYQVKAFENDIVTYSFNKKIKGLLIIASSIILAFGLVLFLSENSRVTIIKTLFSFQGNTVQGMNPLSMVIARSSENIKVVGLGITIIGVMMLVVFAAITAFLKIKTFRIYHVLMFLVLMSIAINIASTFAWANKFAREGRVVNSFLNGIINAANPNDTILIVANPVVNAEALLLGVPDYLNIKANRHRLKALPVLPNGADSTMINQQLFMSTYGNFAPQEFKCIALFPETESLFLENAGQWFDAKNYTRNELERRYTIYSAK
jgi:hypothetical protein